MIGEIEERLGLGLAGGELRINRGKRLGLRIKKAVLPELTREKEEMIVRIKKEGETGSGGILIENRRDQGRAWEN